MTSCQLTLYLCSQVYEAVVMAIEKMDTRTSKMMIELLGSLHRAIIITPTQMRAGFVRVSVSQCDVVLDLKGL